MAEQPVLFPDTEELLVEYLTDEFTARGVSASVHTRVPKTRPNAFVLTPRVGGTRRNLVVDTATIGFECWGLTDKSACDLGRTTRALVFGLRGRVISGAQCYRVDELAGLTNFPDGVSAQSRYIFTASVAFRGVPL
jgi:hypothetical protein